MHRAVLALLVEGEQGDSCGGRNNEVTGGEGGGFGFKRGGKAAFLLMLLVSVSEARAALVEEGGIPVVVEMVEVVLSGRRI